MHSPALLIDGDKRPRRVSRVPECTAERRDLLRSEAIVAKKYEAAEAVFFESPALVIFQSLAAAADDEHLSNFFAQRFHARDYTTT